MTVRRGQVSAHRELGRRLRFYRNELDLAIQVGYAPDKDGRPQLKR